MQVGSGWGKRLVRTLGAALFIAAASPALSMGGLDPVEDARDKLRDAAAAVDKKQYKRAISLLREVLEADSNNADALNYMGYSHRKLGNYDDALKFYWRALAAKPDHRGANEYLGQAYLELNQPARAKERLDQLAKICAPDCEEYKELKKAYDAWQAKNRPNQS